MIYCLKRDQTHALNKIGHNIKKYVWGDYQGKKYSILEIVQSRNQIVIRAVGTKTHLTLHKLDIIKETKQYWLVKYQDSPLRLFKNIYTPISFNWNSPVIKGVWSNSKIGVAKKCGFLNPEKHAISSQGLLIKFMNDPGYEVGGTRIKLNTSSSKTEYLKDINKIGEINLPNNQFIVNFVLSTPENEYKRKSNFSFDTNLGRIFIIVDKIPIIRLKRS